MTTPIHSAPTVQEAPNEIVVTRLFEHPRELMFDAWTNVRHVSNWWGPRGFRTTTHEAEFKSGGLWRFTMHGPDGRDYENRIEFDEIQRPELIAYHHSGEGEDSGVKFVSRVTFEDRPEGTLLTMRMIFETVELRDQIEREYGAVEGAHHTLARLAEHVDGVVRNEIRIERVFDAPRELVWKAWTEPEHLMKWSCPHGFSMILSEGDLRPGGSWRAGMRSPQGEDLFLGGVYREVEQPERLVFSHIWEEDPGEPQTVTWITLTLTEESQGKTRMLFVQNGFKSEESRQGHFGGWSECFETLEKELDAAQPYRMRVSLPSDTEIRITRLFNAPRALVFDAFTKAEHIVHWWGCGKYKTTVEELDFRVGGRWRFVQIGEDGEVHPFKGEYLEIDRPESFVQTFIYDVEFIRDHPVTENYTFQEQADGQTLLINHCQHDSQESRDGHINAGMEEGAASAMRQMDELLERLQG